MDYPSASRKLRFALLLGVTPLVLGTKAAAPHPDAFFETNITNDMNISSGEPEIAVDPRNPRHMVATEFGMGSAKMPASDYDERDLDSEHTIQSSMSTGRVLESFDGGHHWKVLALSPASDPNSPMRGGGDPMIAMGPDGTIYSAAEPPPVSRARGVSPEPNQSYYSQFTFKIAASVDGKTFGKPKEVGTPIDRPWLKVDQSNGTVYTVSSGPFDPKSGKHNVPGPDSPNDRWLVAWKPHLVGRTEPRRIGGPDFSGSMGNTIAATNGVIAATFTLGSGEAGAGFTGSPPPPTPVPASLTGIMQNGVTSCSMREPCLFFETSTDEGAHWVRHHVVVPGGFAPRYTNLTADPSHPGRYAIALQSADHKQIKILYSNDSGQSWSAPQAIPESGSAIDFKPWMEYGPTGVLGLIWRRERTDLVPSPALKAQVGAGTGGPGFDIYTSISCDGGPTWTPAFRVNAVTSPPGPVAQDDFSYIVLDARDAHLVWGDRRFIDKVTNKPGARGGIQAFYGHVPFASQTHGARCGRA